MGDTRGQRVGWDNFDVQARHRPSQQLESELLTIGQQLELVDAIAGEQLERLRRDRNLCAHPSFAPLGGFFKPSAEVTRAHLAVALDHLLQHPPLQGTLAIERFKTFLAGSSFTSSPRYVVNTFLVSSRSSTGRRIVDLAAKHALLELDSPGDGVPAWLLADRAGICLTAFADHDRVLVAEALGKVAVQPRFVSIETDPRGLRLTSR